MSLLLRNHQEQRISFSVLALNELMIFSRLMEEKPSDGEQSAICSRVWRSVVQRGLS